MENKILLIREPSDFNDINFANISDRWPRRYIC